MYIDSGKAKEVVISRSVTDSITGLAISDAESGSEWETENEDIKDSENENFSPQNEEVIEVLQNEKVNSSYSSILKSAKSAKLQQAKKPVKVAEKLAKTGKKSLLKKDEIEEKEVLQEEDEVKKVKKKDPVVFDLMAAIKVI